MGLGMSAPPRRLSWVLDQDSPRGRLLHRIELRARDYLVGEIGPSKWIRWGRLMGLVEAGAIQGYWSAQMVHSALLGGQVVRRVSFLLTVGAVSGFDG